MKNFEDELRGLTSTELYDKGVTFLYSTYATQENYEKALRCFIKALDFGNARAMEEIGYMYEYGFGVSQNIDEAIKWFRRSAESGNKDAMHKLAALIFEHKGDETAAFEWLLKYSDGDNWQAKSHLAGFYCSYVKDAQKAFALYKEAEDNGADCHYVLGEMYLDGIGTEKNVRKAIKYFEKAAQVPASEDDADNYIKWDSMLKLAEIYLHLNDETTALEWLTKRNDGNKFFAMSELAHIYYGDDDFEYEDTSLIDKDKAFEWFKKLYELKIPYGTYYFAEMWESKSKVTALKIYKDGVTFGSDRCCKRLIQLYLEEGNIIETARWSVKYFEVSDERFFKNWYRAPFKEIEQIAKFFIDTPIENLIRLYGGDKKLAADEISKFIRACDLVGLDNNLEMKLTELKN